jgi:hypothetical protein
LLTYLIIFIPLLLSSFTINKLMRNDDSMAKIKRLVFG